MTNVTEPAPETAAESAARVQDATTALETLVDRHGLANVVESLAIVCDLKQDHIQTNWQDRPLADRWQSASLALTRAVARIRRFGPPG